MRIRLLTVVFGALCFLGWPGQKHASHDGHDHRAETKSAGEGHDHGANKKLDGHKPGESHRH